MAHWRSGNVRAQRFYERLGFDVAAVREGVVTRNAPKPRIPLVGENGVPVRDEIEYELRLG